MRLGLSNVDDVERLNHNERHELEHVLVLGEIGQREAGREEQVDENDV